MKSLLTLLLLLPCWCWGQDTTLNWTKLTFTKDTVIIENGIGIGVATDSSFNQYLVIDTSMWQRKPKLRLENDVGDFGPIGIDFDYVTVDSVTIWHPIAICDTVPDLILKSTKGGSTTDLPSATTHTPPPYTIHGSTLKRLIREGKIDTTPIEKIFKDIARSQGWDTVPIPIRPAEPLPAWPMRDIRIIREPLRIDNDCDLELALTKVAIDSLKKELLKCQEKSKIDEATIDLLFKSLEIYQNIFKYKGITVPTKKIKLLL